jgi:spoIIIJ-associated protein
MVVKTKTKKKTVRQKKKGKGVDKISVVKEMAEELLRLMGIIATPTVSEDKENDAIIVDIETEEEAGLLIGTRGETLNSLQAVLGMMFRQKTGEWQRIIVNVADWRERQEDRLNELAIQAAERAKTTSDPQPLYNLTSAERRIIHLALADDEDVETESQGEGQERYLVVNPKKVK